MEVYILDSLYRRDQVVDLFESFIWSERFKAFGDFELKIHSNSTNRQLFKPGIRLTHNETYRVATMETVEDATDEEGREMLTLRGRTLEAILQNRVARGSLADLTTEPKWILEGTPTEIVRQMFHDICVTGILDAGDIIAGVSETSLFPEDTIDEPLDEIIYEVEPMDLYQAMVNLCEAYDIGFRFTRNPDTGQLHFDVYMGSDRTTAQNLLPPVVFSPDLDNLSNTSELTTSVMYKNVAYVISPVGMEIVYALDVDPSIAGFERHVLLVKADDITDPDPPTASDQMIRRGQAELAKNRRYSAFDGEVSRDAEYSYDNKYSLGDLVETRSDNGTKTWMQVTEQIFTSDREGDRSFPTLSVNTFITPGAWLEMGVIEWDDMTDEEWEDMP